MSETWTIIVFLGGLELVFGALWFVMWFIDRHKQTTQQDTLEAILGELIVLNERLEASDVRLAADSRRPLEQHNYTD